jgi:hypothetical protein
MAMRPTKTSLSLVKPSSKPARLLLLLVGTFWLILGACRQKGDDNRGHHTAIAMQWMLQACGNELCCPMWVVQGNMWCIKGACIV